MSAAQHTPAPWHAGGPHQCTVYDRFGQRIANSFEGVMATQRSDGECAANALLIAASPELLAVAQLLALATDEGDDLAVGTHYIDKAGRIRAKGSFLDTIEKARAAIAKATGEAS